MALVEMRGIAKKSGASLLGCPQGSQVCPAPQANGTAPQSHSLRGGSSSKTM
ncbi:UNVERIFIED_CONTAM: hypothetical protein ABID98_003330 [Brevibacillus sp. OAP136]